MRLFATEESTFCLLHTLQHQPSRRPTNTSLVHPSFPLSTYSSHIPDRLETTPLRTHRLTDCPTTFTHDLSPGAGPDPFRAQIPDVIDNRTSQTPPETRHHLVDRDIREQYASARPVASQGACLTTTPYRNTSSHPYTSLLRYLAFGCFPRPAVYGARDSPSINISVYECAVRCRGRSSTRISSWRGRFAQIGLHILQHGVGASGRLHEQR